MFKVCLAAATLAAVIPFVGCSKSSSKDLLIASANPMTGDSAQFGDMKVKAIQLALDEVNAKGGISGKQVKLLVGDDTGNPKEAPSVAQKFAADDHVLAVIGHWNSSCTLASRGHLRSCGNPGRHRLGQQGHHGRLHPAHLPGVPDRHRPGPEPGQVRLRPDGQAQGCDPLYRQ